MAAWLGLVPNECSTGGKQRSGGTITRFKRYVQTLPAHRARSCLETLGKGTDQLQKWMRRILDTDNRRVVIVASVARIAPIAWTLLKNGQRFGASGQAIQLAWPQPSELRREERIP